VCERTACTVRCGGGRKPDQSGQHAPRGPGASARPYSSRPARAAPPPAERASPRRWARHLRRVRPQRDPASRSSQRWPPIWVRKRWRPRRRGGWPLLHSGGSTVWPGVEAQSAAYLLTCSTLALGSCLVSGIPRAAPAVVGRPGTRPGTLGRGCRIQHSCASGFRHAHCIGVEVQASQTKGRSERFCKPGDRERTLHYASSDV
jgi:hypothetical protein